MIRLAVLCLLAAAPAAAENLCGAGPDAFARLDGAWTAEPKLSLENEVLSEIRAPGPETLTLEDGTLASDLIDGLLGAPVPLVPSDAPVYDVDAVDDLLDTTEHADLADVLSDTLCGPEALPQAVATIEVDGGIGVEGTITLIAYFDDRLLELTELQVTSDETVVFLTRTALLEPAER